MSILLFFSLVDTIPGGMNAFIAYRRPIANQYVSLQQFTISYFYIAATNGDTNVVSGQAKTVTRTSQDRSLLRIRFINAFVLTSGLNVVLNQNAFNVDTSLTVGYTVVGEYTLINVSIIHFITFFTIFILLFYLPSSSHSLSFIFPISEPLSILDFPSVVNASSFHCYESENIKFMCRANGTDAKLKWYFNGLQLINNNETLILNDVSLARTGVYQCFWEGFFDDERESVSWALSVQSNV